MIRSGRSTEETIKSPSPVHNTVRRCGMQNPVRYRRIGAHGDDAPGWRIRYLDEFSL